MAALALLFFDYLYAGLMSEGDADQYIAGLIILGAAPCTAMVFVWSQLTKGDPAYTLVQVSVNDLVMIVAFAPIVALLLGVTDIVVPWETLLLSVGLYVVIPLAAGALTRRRVIASHGGDTASVDAFTARLKPWSIVGLLATVVLLFAFQAETIVSNPLLIALIAIPIIIQSYGIFALAYAAAKAWKVPHDIAAPCALIGTSNFFELAVAVAIGLFGLTSGAALATVVGVLVEVPVMLSLVAFASWTRRRGSCCFTDRCANAPFRGSRWRRRHGCSNGSAAKRAFSTRPTCRCPTRSKATITRRCMNCASCRCGPKGRCGAAPNATGR